MPDGLQITFWPSRVKNKSNDRGKPFVVVSVGSIWVVASEIDRDRATYSVTSSTSSFSPTHFPIAYALLTPTQIPHASICDHKCSVLMVHTVHARIKSVLDRPRQGFSSATQNRRTERVDGYWVDGGRG